MSRLALVLALLVGCAEAPEPEAAEKIVPATEVEMEAAELMIPASEAEMLREEIRLLKEEAERLKTELTESKAPATREGQVHQGRQSARLSQAMAELASARSKLDELQAELDTTKAKLAVSEEKNEKLTVELAETEEALEDTRVDLRRTQDDLDGALRVASDVGWSDLQNQAQVALCPKGGRKKMSSCRDEAKAAVAPMEMAVRECLREGQAAPTLTAAERGDDMPRHAVWLGKSNADWYVLLCDPSLPEARELIASSAQRGSASAVEDNLKDLDDDSRKTRKVSYDKEPERPRATAEPEDRMDAEPVDLLDDVSSTSVGNFDILEIDELDEDDGKKKRKKDKDEDELERFERSRRTLSGAGSDLSDE